MIQVKPGQFIPISVTIPNLEAGLVVKTSVQKMDGTILGSVTLTEVHSGEHAAQSFAMPYGQEFLRLVSSVFDSDGVTPNTSNGSFDELVQVDSSVIASRVVVTVGCDDVQSSDPFDVVATGDKSLLIEFKDENGRALNVSTASALVAKLKKIGGGAISKSLVSGISWVNAQGGVALMDLLTADLVQVPSGMQVMEVELTMGGKKYVEQVQRAFNLVSSVIA